MECKVQKQNIVWQMVGGKGVERREQGSMQFMWDPDLNWLITKVLL